MTLLNIPNKKEKIPPSAKKKNNDEDNKTINPCDVCFRDDRCIDNNERATRDISVSHKLEKNIDNSNQSSNQEDPNCVFVIYKSSHTSGIDNDDLDTHGPSSVSDKIDIILSAYSSVEADDLVCDINGNTDDGANTISTCIDSSSTTNAVRDSNEDDDIGCNTIIPYKVGNNKDSIFSDGQSLTVFIFEYSTSTREESDPFNAFHDALTNTSIYFDESFDDNAPSNVYAFVPIKTEYTAID